jgi:GTP-binding protein HflX
MINQRITRLKRELETVEKKRDIDRKRRIENPIPKVAIVGYTNAGKSSLLNRFSGADVLAENKLFATLSATTRRTVLPNNMEVLLSDTVGFVRKLPHSLVEAFKSTLEEASYCDFVIEVVDATSPQFEEHHRLTTEVLQEIGAGQKPSLIVVNKVDLIENNYEKAKYRRVFNNPVFVSTHTGEGMEQLQERLMQEFESLRQSLEALIPFDRYDLMALVHRTGDVLSEEATAEGTMVEASVPKRVASCLKPYQLNA